MSTIDPNQRLASVLRAKVSTLRERGSLGGTGHAAPAASRGSVAQQNAEVMAQRISRIAAADPDRRQQAVRIYLEAELTREFGSDLLNDPAFPQMLDAIQQQMQGDTQTSAAVHALGDLLLAGHAPEA
jgi:hypothetical protein